MADFVGAIDQGTTSTRFMVFDHDGREIARHQLEHEQILPRSGWIEHDPELIWQRTQEVVTRALTDAGLSAADLAAVGITNQRETTVVWDRAGRAAVDRGGRGTRCRGDPAELDGRRRHQGRLRHRAHPAGA